MRARVLCTVLLASTVGIGAGPAPAADLREAWLATRQHHPDMAAATATRAAGEARLLQAGRLWNPTVTTQLAAGAMGSRTSSQGAAFSLPGAARASGVGFDTSVSGGPGARWSLEARMPLYSPERSAQERQLRLAAESAGLQASLVQQQLMLHTAQQYFAVVQSQQQYQLLLRQQTATQQARQEATDRFRVGDTPITDVREAEARALAVSAQVQAADVEVQIARQTLAQTTGWDQEQLPQLQPPATLAFAASGVPGGRALPPLAHWLELAARDNLELRAQALAVTLAEQEVAKATRAASMKVDLVAQAGADHLSGSGPWGPASNAARQYALGVQIQVPLSTGGQLDARLQELLHLQDKAQADLESGRLAVAQRVHATWLRLQAGAARTEALDSAQLAARVRLDATQLGRQVGDRTTLALLQAHSDATQSQTDLLQHRIRMAHDYLQLMALTGRLDEDALQAATDSARMPTLPKF